MKARIAVPVPMIVPMMMARSDGVAMSRLGASGASLNGLVSNHVRGRFERKGNRPNPDGR